MFFLLRSAICIGLVVAALPDDARTRPAPPPASAALAGAEKLCRAAPGRCLAVLHEGLRAGSSQAFAALAQGGLAPSQDSLSAVDRLTAWAGAPATD